MKINSLLLRALGASFLAVPTLTAADFLYQGGNANWNGTNWRNSTTATDNVGPGVGTDNHNFGSFLNPGIPGVVTVDSAVATNNLQADRGTRTLDIVAGGIVTVNGQFRMENRANEASTLTTNMGGTSITVTNDFIMASLNSGDSTVFNLNSGTLQLNRGGSINASVGSAALNIQGGSLSGAPTTGFTVNTNGAINVSAGSVNLSGNLILNGGSLNVTGDSAGLLQLGGANFQGLTVNNSISQLNYVFDASGVSSLNMGRLSFGNGISLNLSVNADALEGATVGQQILLLDYNEWRLNNVDQGTAPIVSQLVFTNTGTAITGTLVNDTASERLFYEVATVIPEPSVYAALAGLLLVTVVYARRRKE